MFGFVFEDSRQQAIYQGLRRLVGEGPAEFFLQACMIMAQPNNYPVGANIVGHCIREVESALRDVLLTISIASQTEAKSKGKGHEYEIRQTLMTLGINEDENLSQFWLKWAPQFHRLAHRKNLSSRRVDEELNRVWRDFQDLLYLVLDRFETRFVFVFARLDELLKMDNPSSSDFEQFIREIPHTNVTFEYFFNRLQQPAWLEELRQKGYFGSLPSSVLDNDGYIRYPLWPQGEYLKKMAASAPAAVTEILESMPESDNVLGNLTLVEITSHLPPDKIAKLKAMLVGWFKRSVGYWGASEVSKLVKQLLEGGYQNEALGLASDLIELRSEKGEYGYRLRALVDKWHYNDLLEKLSELFLHLTPQKWFDLHLKLLEQAVSGSRWEGSNPPADYSSVWHPNIDDSNQMSLESIVASSFARTAKRLVENNAAQLEPVISQLVNQPWAIFTRIALHLLTQYPQVSYPLLKRWVIRQDWFRGSSDPLGWQVRPEYARLVKVGFPLLKKEDKECVLSWIEAGPDLEPFRQRFEKDGELPNPQQEARHVEHWQRDWLFLLEEHLDEEWKMRLENLSHRLGKPSNLLQPYVVTEWVDVRSPKTLQELLGMESQKLINFLKDWAQPENRFDEPSIEGLGRTLSEAAKKEPIRFSSFARDFATSELDPTYLRNVLFGLNEAVQAQFQSAKMEEPKPQHNWSEFDWESVLKLCRFVVEQHDTLPEQEEYAFSMRDPGYRWAKGTVADLLRSGFMQSEAEIPFNLRDSVWEIVALLIRDPQPTPEYEKQSNMDFLTLSLNVNRGKAFHALILYAAWTRKNLGGNLKDMPEVKERLEKHLNINFEPSLSVRSVFGQYLPFLFNLDFEWTTQFLDQILPANAPEYWRVAWSSYLRTNSPYPSLTNALKPYYIRAIQQFTGQEEKSQHQDAQERLAEHILAIYLFDEEDGKKLVSEFFTKSPLSLRKFLLQRAGAWISHPPDGGYTSEEIQRFQNLLENRIIAASKQPESKAELSEVGYWMLPSQLEPEWQLIHLQEILELTGWVEPHFPVFDLLVSISSRYPRQAVMCLEYMTKANPNSWHLRHYLEYEGQSVLISAINSYEDGVKPKAEELINRLVAKGYTSLYKLLDPSGS